MKGQIPEAINAYAGTLEPLSQDVRKKCLTLRERQHNEVFLMLLEKGLLPALKDNGRMSGGCPKVNGRMSKSECNVLS